MDPSTNAFTPQSEIWRLNNAMKTFQDIQQDHADRLSRVERRQDEEAKVKSVWGPSSPFPGVLSGTPQQNTRPLSRFFPPTFDSLPSAGPANQSSAADFANFDDDHSNNMIRSLQLDSEDEPRRTGATSRANSVRFDESATQGQLAHPPRQSVDLNSRLSGTLGGLGGLPMFERSSSHKSDGRHSSAGQSAMSGRANSLGLDTTSQLPQNPSEQPGLTPGLLLLGTVPSIIRCWLNNEFSHDRLLYAAVCTGSYKSILDARIVRSLGLSGHVRQDINGDDRIKIPLYLPEAVLHPSSSRPNSPTQQLPSLTVDFTVVDNGEDVLPAKGIQIIIASDTLRLHRADISFVSNCITAFDDESSKLSIPLVRPEDDATFKTLCTVNVDAKSERVRRQSDSANTVPASSKPGSPMLPNGIVRASDESVPTAGLNSPKAERNSSSPRAEGESQRSTEQRESRRKSRDGQDHDRKPSLGPLTIARSVENKDAAEPSPLNATVARTNSSPAIWSNWRREGSMSQPGQSDWANVSRGSSTNYTRPTRDQGIKVLKPTRQASRSSNMPQTASPTVTGQSRFFDDGKRRNGPGSSAPSGPGSDSGDSSGNLRRTASLENNSSKSGMKENASSSAPKTPRSANPIGGASAFGWLNSGQEK